MYLKFLSSFEFVSYISTNFFCIAAVPVLNICDPIGHNIKTSAVLISKECSAGEAIIVSAHGRTMNVTVISKESNGTTHTYKCQDDDKLYTDQLHKGCIRVADYTSIIIGNTLVIANPSHLRDVLFVEGENQ